MINTKEFYESLNQNGIDFYTGVPDSLLKDICSYISDNAPVEKHIIAANEGGAIALAMGYYLATSKTSIGIYAKFWFWKYNKSIIVSS